MHRICLATVILVFQSVCSLALAETLRWANSGDALTLDPHALHAAPTHTINQQIYEPLVLRNHQGELEPALATQWMQSAEDARVWSFKLRKGVTFHDGSEFTSQDVRFSIERAQQLSSGVRELVSSVTSVREIGPYDVEIVTAGANPILPAYLTHIYMMDKDWAEANDTVAVQDYASGLRSHATEHTNGTGPYQLVSREPDVLTRLVRNEAYWGREEFALDVREVVFTPVQNGATRVAALLSGEFDFVQDLPIQDIERVAAVDGLSVLRAPQNRTIFFGMNQGASDLASDDVLGANPFSDVRVRKAIAVALDRTAIRQIVMRGQSQPAGMIVPPFVHGWSQEMDKLEPPNVEQAKALLEEAGYMDGFTIRLDCPNDRYINDEQICQAAIGMLAKIGINVSLAARSKSQHFPMIRKGEADFYLLGWGAASYDSADTFKFLVHGRTDGFGAWNATGYNDAGINEKIRALDAVIEPPMRDSIIREIWTEVQRQQVYVPVHHQVLAWGLSQKYSVDVDPGNQPKVKYFKATPELE